MVTIFSIQAALLVAYLFFAPVYLGLLAGKRFKSNGYFGQHLFLIALDPLLQ